MKPLGAARVGSTQDSLQGEASALEPGASSFQGKFRLHSQTQGWEGALPEGCTWAWGDLLRDVSEGMAEGGTESSWSGFCGSC